MSESTGDWYCKKCGFIAPEKVTSGKCETCGGSVSWHKHDGMLTDMIAHRLADLLRQKG